MKNSNGFSLIEMMVVIVIFAILVGMAAYGIWGMNSTLRYKQGADMALWALRSGRAKANRAETEANVIFTAGPPATYQILWVDRVTTPSVPQWITEGQGTFPNGVTYMPTNGIGPDVFRFFADGHAEVPVGPGQARVINNNPKRLYSQTIQVLPASGLARIY